MIDSSVIRHYLGHLLFFTLVINFIFFISIYNLNHRVKELNENAILKNIVEYQEFDLEQICRITDCKAISTNLIMNTKENTFVINDRGVLENTFTPIKSTYQFFGMNYDDQFNSIIYFKKYKITIVLNDNILFKEVVNIFYLINLVFIIVFTLMYFRNSFNEKKRSLLSLHDKESSIQEKYINLLNENINHELSTPVTIIKGKTIRAQQVIEKYLINSNSKTDPIFHDFFILFNEDFPLIFQAIEAINSVMERTSNWKRIKYNNTIVPIYDIISSVCLSMKNFTKNMQYEINPVLKNIVLDGSYNNGDLQLCLMNHIKNSAEAKASIMLFEGIYSSSTKSIHLFITDNGHGILDKHNRIISPSRYEKIFDPYYSTKDGDNCERNNIILTWLCDLADYLEGLLNFNETKKNIKQIRGIGTYLNRTTLRNTGGNLKIRFTSHSGTTFEVITKAKILSGTEIPINFIKN